jgi:hypothetical protein
VSERALKEESPLEPERAQERRAFNIPERATVGVPTKKSERALPRALRRCRGVAWAPALALRPVPREGPADDAAVLHFLPWQHIPLRLAEIAATGSDGEAAFPHGHGAQYSMRYFSTIGQNPLDILSIVGLYLQERCPGRD